MKEALVESKNELKPVEVSTLLGNTKNFLTQGGGYYVQDDKIVLPKKVINYDNPSEVHIGDDPESWCVLEEPQNEDEVDTENWVVLPNHLDMEIKESLYSELVVTEKNTNATSGKQACLDLPRMSLKINSVPIPKELIRSYINNQEEVNSRKTARNVFIKMFKHINEANVPNEPIIEELITNCNQAGYESFTCVQFHKILNNFHEINGGEGLRLITVSNGTSRSINIEFIDSKCISISHELLFSAIADNDPDKEEFKLKTLLKFKLRFNEDNQVVYEDVKLSLFFDPKQLEPVLSRIQCNIQKPFPDLRKKEPDSALSISQCFNYCLSTIGLKY